MDKTDTYVRMADCPEIQQSHVFEDGDIYSFLSSDLTPGREGWSCPQVWHKPWWKAVTFLWLPRQDQLQAMVGLSPYQLCVSIARLVSAGYVDDDCESKYSEQFTSMEQLWLAFVMQEKHNKGWNGNAWVLVE